MTQLNPTEPGVFRVALTQMRTVWESPAANEALCARLARQAKDAGAHLCLFPEFTLTGFTPRPQDFADTTDAPAQRAFFRSLSQELDLDLIAGISQASATLPQNRLIWTHHGEVVLDYAKIHSYTFGGETHAYSRGERIFASRVGGLSLGAFICYDLRFPEIFQVAARVADAIVVIGNWPGDRLENWFTLLRARALETQCFILGVNRAGEGGGIAYAPSSVVFGPDGRRLTAASDDDLLFCDIDPRLVRQVRTAFPLRDDRREDLYPSLLFRDPENGTIG